MKHVGTRSFTDMLLQELNGNYPGDYFQLRKRNPSKHILRTSANERARENYEYWYKEPQPVRHSKDETVVEIHVFIIYTFFKRGLTEKP